MGHGRAACSGLFWCFLKHRGKNAGYFWVQRWDSLQLSMPLNTAAEGFKEELMNTSEWKHGSQYNIPVKRLHKQPLNKALATASVGNPNKTTTHFYFYIFFWGGGGFTKITWFVKYPRLVFWEVTTLGFNNHQTKWRGRKEIVAYLCLGKQRSPFQVRLMLCTGINGLLGDKPNDVQYRILIVFQVLSSGMCKLEI